MKRLDYTCKVSGNSIDRSVYLTFDDGPNPFCTPDILDVLAERRVPATFFVIGAYAADQPELIRRMVAEGHEVGNHTMTHPDLTTCGPEEIEHQITEASKAIKAASPQAEPKHMRAPYGLWNEDVLSISARAGLKAAHWSVDPRDWSRPGVNVIVDAVLDSVQPGAIVLLHDGCPPGELVRHKLSGLRDQTLMALSRVITGLHDRGFVIRLLSQDN
ncbi:chitooligosaccharide deacetylase NodB [Sinorhizobium saheli]|uniref:Chitooligosaccharide deacetylase n=2 Tax=Sinorhizobium saheli TaxID=36856 RepID=A0A178XYH9_SINSA|nr:chitooligosaccharide deacetylase NodB [Sinorhizobium saheli]MQW86679.1 chitooligosaccharide deacetylase NodB [Sinorhizobium saheli]OAP40174.1 chitooligosaccharide deacetylase NodB [Sinorhizobium saheli]